MLFTELKEGEGLYIGGTIIRVVHKSGSRVRLSVDAPREVHVNTLPYEPPDEPKTATAQLAA